MKTAEERPKVKYYYWKDATVSEVAESYNKAPELFKYAQALDNYIDYLEEYAQQQQPTDEEIANEAAMLTHPTFGDYTDKMINRRIGFKQGAKWMRDNYKPSSEWINVDNPPKNDRKKEYILMDVFQQKDIAHYYDDTWFTESPLANGNELLVYIPVPEFKTDK